MTDRKSGVSLSLCPPLVYLIRTILAACMNLCTLNRHRLAVIPHVNVV